MKVEAEEVEFSTPLPKRVMDSYPVFQEQSKRYKASVTYASIFWEKEGLVTTGNTACHAGLSTWNNLDKPLSVFSSVQSLHCNDTIARRYFEWLLNYSPFAPGFVSKSARKAVEDGVVVGDVNAPDNIMAGGMIATRFVSERYTVGRPELWDKLVERGVHPNVAYVFAHNYLKTGNFLYQGDASHQVIDGTWYSHGWDRALNFIQNKPVKPNKPYYVTKRYSDIQACWGSQMPSPVVLGPATTKLLQEVAVDRKSTNPFALAKPGAKKDPKFEVAVEALAPFLKEGYRAYV